MEVPLIRQKPHVDMLSMNSICARFRVASRWGSFYKARCYCAATSLDLTTTPNTPKNLSSKGRVRAKDSDAQLKEDWLDSLSCPFPDKLLRPNGQIVNGCHSNSESKWVIGIDPDVSGALAVLKTVDLGHSAEVFDSPHVKVLVGGRTRRRLDAKSIVQLLKSLDAPLGTIAYIEQSIPYPQDGKQGWWSGGFGYGLWIGILVASGLSVIPVPSAVWKNEFKLCGNPSSKDDSREVASTLFPSISPLLRRKKDHGRAEALLIAAYGKGLQGSTNPSFISEEATS
ncbi:hypothetical protein NMG60_11033579 [Bertholletia excelsa]